jgi:hypothetical protein
MPEASNNDGIIVTTESTGHVEVSLDPLTPYLRKLAVGFGALTLGEDGVTMRTVKVLGPESGSGTTH